MNSYLKMVALGLTLGALVLSTAFMAVEMLEYRERGSSVEVVVTYETVPETAPAAIVPPTDGERFRSLAESVRPKP